MSLVLVLGGEKSGKSRFALEMARRQSAPVTFIATGEGRDASMRERIARHREERPTTWTTIEDPLHLSRSLKSVRDEECVIIDCLTLWTSNTLEHVGASETEKRASKISRVAGARTGLTLAVSNEVGLGIVAANELARTYSELLGRVNTLWANAANDVYFMIAGRALSLPRTALFDEDTSES
ncbi:MAG: bifunctional adenosylcobinamide kinase/adenosylcobinamide-phosphate guanylyltransferase [Acidimicrobiales bacterium]